MGETVGPAAVPAPAAWIHVSRDAVAACQLMLAGALSPADYLRGFKRPVAFAAFAVDDPLPGLAELPLALMRVVTRRLPILVRELVKVGRQRFGRTATG
jgi:predicted ATP-grasp superfamily ATP-dependent carboligase